MKILENKRWKNHPWSEFGHVYNTDINLIHSIANPKATDYTDLLNGDIVHRIKVAKDKGYTHLPAAFFVFKESVFNSLNGNHFFNAKEIVDFNKLIKCPYPYQVDPKKIMRNNYFI